MGRRVSGKAGRRQAREILPHPAQRGSASHAPEATDTGRQPPAADTQGGARIKPTPDPDSDAALLVNYLQFSSESDHTDSDLDHNPTLGGALDHVPTGEPMQIDAPPRYNNTADPINTAAGAQESASRSRKRPRTQEHRDAEKRSEARTRLARNRLKDVTIVSEMIRPTTLEITPQMLGSLKHDKYHDLSRHKILSTVLEELERSQIINRLTNLHPGQIYQPHVVRFLSHVRMLFQEHPDNLVVQYTAMQVNLGQLLEDIRECLSIPPPPVSDKHHPHLYSRLEDLVELLHTSSGPSSTRDKCWDCHNLFVAFIEGLQIPLPVQPGGAPGTTQAPVPTGGVHETTIVQHNNVAPPLLCVFAFIAFSTTLFSFPTSARDGSSYQGSGRVLSPEPISDPSSVQNPTCTTHLVIGILQTVTCAMVLIIAIAQRHFPTGLSLGSRNLRRYLLSRLSSFVCLFKDLLRGTQELEIEDLRVILDHPHEIRNLSFKSKIKCYWLIGRRLKAENARPVPSRHKIKELKEVRGLLISSLFGWRRSNAPIG